MSDTSKFRMDFIFDFLPSLSSLPRDIFSSLTMKMQRTLKEHDDIIGIFIISTSIDQPLIYSRSIQDFETITEVAELINSFDVHPLIRDLSARGYHGVEIITFPDFSLGLMKLTDTDVFAVLIAPTDHLSLEVQDLVSTIKSQLFDEDAVKKMSTVPAPEKKEKEESTTPSPINSD